MHSANKISKTLNAKNPHDTHSTVRGQSTKRVDTTARRAGGAMWSGTGSLEGGPGEVEKGLMTPPWGVPSRMARPGLSAARARRAVEPTLRILNQPGKDGHGGPQDPGAHLAQEVTPKGGNHA